MNEVVRVAPLLPTPLDDAIICAQADLECGTWSSSYWINDGNAGGIGIYASGVPSPFHVPNNGKLAAHIFIANIWLLLGYGPNIPTIVSDVSSVSGLSSYFTGVNNAAKDPKRPRVWRIQDLNIPYTSSSGSSECTYACDPNYPSEIVNRFNGAVSAPNTHPATVPAGTTGTATTTTTVETTSGPDIGREVVALARKQVGKPYVWATHGPNTFDCCLTGDTLIPGPDGVRRIDEIEPGHRVWSFADGRFQPQPVTAAWQSKRQPVYRLRTQGRSITASANHPFLAVERTGGKLPIEGRGQRRNEHAFVWRRLDELRRGDRIVVMRRADNDSPPMGDLDFAWLLGLIVGDGHVSTSRQPSLSICVYGDTRERAAAIIRRLGGGNPTFGESYGLRVSAATLSRALLEMGIGRPSYEKRVPPCVWGWDEAAQRAFLDGYAAADGYEPTNRSRHGERTYASASPDLIREIRMLHLTLGDAVGNVSTNLRTKPITIKGVAVKRARPLHSFTVWCGRRETGAKLATGWTQVKEMIDAAGGRWTIRPVLGIEAAGEEDTYDIEVAGAGNFVADGVVVHNSGLVCWCYAQITGKWITCGSVEQFDSVGWGVARANLYPGDLLFYDTEYDGTAGHVGIWTGDTNPNTQMVNAENPSVGVVYANPFDSYFAPLYLGAKRLYNPPSGVLKTVTVIGYAVTNQSLNMRTGPGGTYDLLMVIAKGTTVDVISADKNGYTEIAFQGHEGWGATTSLTMTSAPASGTTTTTTGGAPSPPSTPKPPTPVKSPLTTWKVAAIITPHTTFGGVDYTMPQTEYNKASALQGNIPGRVALLSGNRCKVSKAFFYKTGAVTTATALPDGTHYVGPNDIADTLAFINGSGYDHVFVFYPDEGIHSSNYAVTLQGAGGGYTAMKVFDSSGWGAKAESDESIRQFMLEVGYLMQSRNACRFPDLLNPSNYSSKGNLNYGDQANGLSNFLQDTMTGQLIEKASGLSYGMSDSAWKTGPPVTTNTEALPGRPTDLPDDAVFFPREVDTSQLQPGDVLLVTARGGVPFSATPTGPVLGYVPAGTRLVALSGTQQVAGGVPLTNVSGRYGAGWVPLGYEDITTAYPDWCLNGRLDDDLHGVYANVPTMDLTRAFAGDSFTAMAATWGVSPYEGIRFESGTSLGLPGGRTVVVVAELCGVGRLDSITCRLWSHRGPAIQGEALTGYEDLHLGSTVTMQPDAWQRIVVPAVMEDPSAPLQKVELHLVNQAPLKQVWHARGVRFVDVG